MHLVTDNTTMQQHPAERVAGNSPRATALHGAVYRFEYRGDNTVMAAAGEAIEAITGYPASDFIENRVRTYQSVIHPDDIEAVGDIVAGALGRGDAYSVEYRIFHADGSTRWVQGHGRGIFDEQQSPIGLEGVIFDITDRRQSEERLAHMALHDPLTDLPNRSLFQEHLRVAVAHANRTGSCGAVLFIDLDDFKLINDTFGHAVGDELLVSVAERLRGAIRSDDVVARQGGDEFLILMQGSDAGGDRESIEFAASTLAAKLRAALAQPFAVVGTELYVTASVGASLFPVDGDSTETLLKRADIALYAAKDAGRDGYQAYRRPDRDPGQELALASRLRQAERRGELVLHYQPMVELETSCIVGAEALIRWQHPEEGLLPPGRFLAVAERTGLIRPISDWVLEQACVQVRRWCDQDLDLYASVNLTPALWHPASMRRVLATIEAHGLSPDRIMIEVTEQSAMTQTTDLKPVLAELRNRGLRLAIDDFGTGYSSLGRLRNLHVHMLKIDRSYINDVPADGDACILVETMITLSQKLGLQCLAEGIETEAQLAFLRNLGCPLGQGYLFSRPLPAADFSRLIGANQQAA
jgi:diguanylate cyclase (GGDEF)-like protein/PAS domain S-box-containing protein